MAMVAAGSGARLKAVRERRALSQRDLAARADVSQSTLNRIENGSRAAKMPELLALAQALGCPVSEISEHSAVRDRLICLARTPDADTQVIGTPLHAQMVHLFEVSAFLDDHGIPRS